MPTIIRRTTERTVVAAMSSMRVNAATQYRGVKPRPSRNGCEGRILFGNAKYGIRNLRKEKAEKWPGFADVA